MSTARSLLSRLQSLIAVIWWLWEAAFTNRRMNESVTHEGWVITVSPNLHGKVRIHGWHASASVHRICQFQFSFLIEQQKPSTNNYLTTNTCILIYYTCMKAIYSLFTYYNALYMINIINYCVFWILEKNSFNPCRDRYGQSEVWLRVFTIAHAKKLHYALLIAFRWSGHSGFGAIHFFKLNCCIIYTLHC